GPRRVLDQVDDRPPAGRGRGHREHLLGAGHPRPDRPADDQPRRSRAGDGHRPGAAQGQGAEDRRGHVQLVRLRRHQRLGHLQEGRLMAGPIRGAGAPKRQRSGRATALLAASATFSLFLIAAIVAAWSVFYAPGPSARDGAEATIVTLPSGAGVSAIAANLKAAGVIRSTDMFKAAATLTGADRRLRAGEYEVPSGAS